MQVKQPSRQSPPAPWGRDRDRQNLRFLQDPIRQNESGQAVPAHGAVPEHVALDQHALDLAVAPAAVERGAVQSGDRRSIARAHFREHGLAAREQAPQERDHRRGSRAASCGRASGARR